MERSKSRVQHYSGFEYETATQSPDLKFSRVGYQWVIDRLIQGKADKFRNKINLIEDRTRTIIVSDFSLNLVDDSEGGPNEIRKMIVAVICHLMDDKRKVKFWDGKNLIDVTDTTDTNWPQVAPMLQTDLETMREKFPGEHVYFLDYFSARALLHELNILPHTFAREENIVYYNDILNDYGHFTAPKIFEWLSETPAFTLHHGFEREKADRWESEERKEEKKERNKSLALGATVQIRKLLAKFPLRMTGVYFLQVKDNQLFDEVMKLPNLATLGWDDTDCPVFSKLNNIKLKQLTVVVDDATLPQLAEYLRGNEQLQRLTIIGEFSEEGAKQITRLSPNLQSLSLREMHSVDAAHIINLAPACLEELVVKKIIDPDKFTHELITNENAFRNLRQFAALDSVDDHDFFPSYNGISMTLDCMLKIYSLARKMTKLELYKNRFYFKKIGDPLNIDLSHLTEVEIKDCDYNSDAILRILQFARQISSLRIEESRYDSSVRSNLPTTSSFPLPLLRKIVIGSANCLDGDTAACIVTRAENLVSLEVGSLFHVERLSPHLRELSVKSMSFIDYHHLLSITPEISTFDLTVVSGHVGLHALAQLPHIKKLIISNDSKSIAFLKPVLETLPNLEEIECRKPTYMGPDETITSQLLPDQLSLPHLTRASFANIEISAKALAKILASSRKKLEVSKSNDQSLADFTPDLIPKGSRAYAVGFRRVPLETYIRLVCQNAGKIDLNDYDAYTDYHLSENLDLDSIKTLRSASSAGEAAGLQLLARCKMLESVSIYHPRDLTQGRQSVQWGDLHQQEFIVQPRNLGAWLRKQRQMYRK